MQIIITAVILTAFSLGCLALPGCGSHGTDRKQAVASDDGRLPNTALEWNGIFVDTLTATNTANAVSSRLAAIVHTAMFDAYNGVRQEYMPIFHIQPAPDNTNVRAAMIAASHTVMVSLFPSRKPQLDASYVASLGAVGGGDPERQRGIDYGVTVAQAVLAWRATDRFSSPVPAFTGGTATGQWRPTPPASGAMSAQSLVFTKLFVLDSDTRFRPPAPRNLSSKAYADDFNAVKALGRKNGSTRTEDQTALAPFWEGNATIHWNQAANQAAQANRLGLSKSVRLFAVPRSRCGSMCG